MSLQIRCASIILIYQFIVAFCFLNFFNLLNFSLFFGILSTPFNGKYISLCHSLDLPIHYALIGVHFLENNHLNIFSYLSLTFTFNKNSFITHAFLLLSLFHQTYFLNNQFPWHSIYIHVSPHAPNFHFHITNNQSHSHTHPFLFISTDIHLLQTVHYLSTNICLS